MTVARETVLNALLAYLGTAGAFATQSRRLIPPEKITPAMSPALFLFQESEMHDSAIPNLPAIGRFHVLAALYNNAGTDENVIPETALNVALDGIDAAFKISDANDGFVTLGGVIYSIRRNGESKFLSGALTGCAGCIVPIQIIAP